MRVGLLARAEDRGLGIQTWEWYRAMEPDATLVVDMGRLAGGFTPHTWRYPGATVAAFDGAKFTDEQLVRDWLDQVDVAYTAETFYDPRLPIWCAQHQVRLAVHVNPEFWKHPNDWRSWPALRWWSPTSWRLNTLPEVTEVVPVPVPLDRWPDPAPLRDEPVFVHVVGHRAAADRNGTSLFMAALQHVAGPMRVRLITQGHEALRVPAVASSVHVEVVTGGVTDYWRMYDDADVFVLPRRYGGLCLPANEAAGAGLALTMTDCAPNQRWPIVPLRVAGTSSMSVPAGTIRMHNADVYDLARQVQRLAVDHEARHERQRASRAWAEAMSWPRLRPLIVEHLTSS